MKTRLQFTSARISSRLRLVWLACAAVAAGMLLTGTAAAQAVRDGVTVWVYSTGEAMNQLGVVVEGYTPNYSNDHPRIDFVGGWPGGAGPEGTDPLNEYYIGRIWGRLKVSTGGNHELRLTSDDGAKLFVNGALVLTNDVQGQFGERTAVAVVNLSIGKHPIDIRFFQNTGGAKVLLEWKPPGASSFVTVPTTSLETDDGQTHVVAPGFKPYYYESGGGSVGGPGDARPLDGVHPSYTLSNFRPLDFQPQVGGVDFLPDGRLAICTWDRVGAVYILGNLNGLPGTATVTRFAEGLGEPLGLKVVDGAIYVAQRGEVTRLRDTDGDGIADEYESVGRGWPMSHNYHEFTFGLVYKDGSFYVATSVPLRTGDTLYIPTTLPAGEDHYPVPNGPGSLIKIEPGSRTWEIIAKGLRTPNGLGIGPDGELFCGDNQGAWMPSSKLNFLQPGGFYGHQAAAAGNTPSIPPALWLPHNEISNSPAEPTVVPSGPYAGQVLYAELTHGGVKRAFLEKINGRYQGAVFRFSQGLEVGMNRLAWGPEGALYLGGLGSSGNWNWNSTRFGLQRLAFNGTTTFEMKSVRSRANGFIIELTWQAPYEILANPANYTLQRWSYNPTASYGGGKIGTTSITPTSVRVSQDRRRVFLQFPPVASQVYYFRLRNFLSDSPVPVAPWSTEAWYTLNNVGTSSGPDFEPVAPLPTLGADPGVDLEFQAENATLGPGVLIETEHAGYTGTGFVNLPPGPTSSWVEFAVNVPTAGAYNLSFRHALGATARSMTLSINGGAGTVVTFPSTGGWAVWQEHVVNRTLNAGLNAVRLSTTSDGPNLDRLTIPGAGSVSPTPWAYFEHWAGSHGLAGPNAGPDLDPDNDGLNTLVEYGAGGNPKSAGREAGGLPLDPQLLVSQTMIGNHVQITYRRRIDFAARGLSYGIEGKAELQTAGWGPLAVVQVGETLPAGDGETEFVTVRTVVPLPSSQNSFFTRVVVQIQAP